MHKIFKKSLIFLICLPTILTGCWDQMPVENTGFVTLVGIESAPLGSMKLTFAMPVIDPTSSSRGELLDIEADLLREGREKLNRTSSKNMAAGKIQFHLFSKEIAEKGAIGQINEILERDPSDPILAWVLVIDGSPRELIHQVESFPDKPRPSTYLNGLLERAASSASIPETRVYTYDITNITPGIDNVVPIIKLDSHTVEVAGSALFSKEKMVGSINQKQSGLLMAMMKTLKNKKYTYQVSDINNENNEAPKHGLAILIGEKSKKINISIKNNKPEVDINLNLVGTIDEYKWDSLKNENNVKQLEEHVQAELQEDCQKLVEYMQSIESDPIGIGDMVRAHYNSYWKQIDWHKTYKTASIRVNVKFEIIQYGAIQ